MVNASDDGRRAVQQTLMTAQPGREAREVVPSQLTVAKYVRAVRAGATSRSPGDGRTRQSRRIRVEGRTPLPHDLGSCIGCGRIAGTWAWKTGVQRANPDNDFLRLAVDVALLLHLAATLSHVFQPDPYGINSWRRMAVIVTQA